VTGRGALALLPMVKGDAYDGTSGAV
jgi:hypothetical protein